MPTRRQVVLPPERTISPPFAPSHAATASTHRLVSVVRTRPRLTGDACAADGVNFGLFSPEQVAGKPVQGHFGAEDTMEGFSDPDTAKKLEESLRAAGNQHAQVFLYPRVGHAFM